MNTFKRIILGTFLAFSLSLSAKESSQQAEFNQAAMKQQATDFFNRYINTYNRRFDHPEHKDKFINELSELLTTPFLMAPPTVAPHYPSSTEKLSQTFEGFVQYLEKMGATKLQWKEINLHVLSLNKILANNVGYATDKNGETVYETISIYLLYRDQNQWKISLFSPYDFANKLSL